MVTIKRHSDLEYEIKYQGQYKAWRLVPELGLDGVQTIAPRVMVLWTHNGRVYARREPDVYTTLELVSLRLNSDEIVAQQFHEPAAQGWHESLFGIERVKLDRCEFLEGE